MLSHVANVEVLTQEIVHISYMISQDGQVTGLPQLTGMTQSFPKCETINVLATVTSTGVQVLPPSIQAPYVTAANQNLIQTPWTNFNHRPPYHPGDTSLAFTSSQTAKIRSNTPKSKKKRIHDWVALGLLFCRTSESKLDL